MVGVTVVSAFFWLIVLAAFYALTEDQPYLQENIAAAGAAILGTIVVMTAAANWETDGVRLPLQKLVELYQVPGKIVSGVLAVTVRILTAAIRGSRLRGRKVRVPFRYGKAHGGADIGRRALETYLECVGPNTMLVAFEKEDDEILIHRI